MEYQKIMNMLENATKQPTKFGARNCVEINYESRAAYNNNNENINNNIKFKTSMIRFEL